MTRVAVVGGGVAGLSAAYYLRRVGAEVTVLEARRVGSGASAGNAGWVTPAQAGPLPEPGLIGYGLRSLLDPQAALYFTPGQLIRMIPWLLRFARRCNATDHYRGRFPLAAMGARSFSLMDALAADGVDAPLSRVAMLVAAKEPRNAQTFLNGLRPLRDLGFAIPGALLGRSELRTLEPALADPVQAGFVLEQHSVIDPLPFVRALRDRLLELGVDVVEGAEVRDADVAGSRVSAVRASTGVHRCDQVVLATGAWPVPLGRARLPIEAGKGYSFELRPSQMPRHALLLVEPHVGASPLGDRLRVAGTMEFSGINGRLDRRRLESIVTGAREMLDGWGPVAEDSLWCGLRPIAPDGLPIVDRHPRLENVFLAAAYSMLGMTLALPAGEALARYMDTGRRPPELEPFRAARFRMRDSLRPSRAS
jgi:D-amino-acid dehydrogenase